MIRFAMPRQLAAFSMVLLLMGAPLLAEANSCWRDSHQRLHCNPRKSHKSGSIGATFSPKTQKLIQGGLIGAGVGVGAGVLLGRPLLQTAVLGAGLGVGTQAVKHSNYLGQHPVMKTAAYGALAGTGVSQITGKGTLLKGALLGGAIGSGVGVLKQSRD